MWSRSTFVITGVFALSVELQAARTEIPAAPKMIIPTYIVDEGVEFKAIFDGKTLQGWDGDPLYWRVENGSIVGETTPQHLLKTNTFLIWRGGKPADFELKLEYRITTSGNSGIQYRSNELSVPGAKWAMSGYQYDIDGAAWGKVFEKFLQPKGLYLPRVTGQIYDEEGRGFLALPGQFSYVIADKEPPRVIASLGDAESMARLIKDGTWNAIDLIARSHHLIQILNGRVIAMTVDEDPEHARSEGLIGLQLHVGDPMKVQFRHIRLKIL